MGIVQALDYRIPQPNALQRSMRAVGSSRPGAWLFSRSIHHIDRVLLRLTRGGMALPTAAAGLPVLTMITRGAKTGLRRATPLLGIPHGDDLAIIGTQFGQPGTPGWYFNLRADPSAEVVYHDKRVRVLAREAEGDEWDAIWDRACGIYLGYESYASRIRDRPIHIMVLRETGPVERQTAPELS
jgi:deazaflavin-dependent oxidoreductase (nitroreductase family)